MSDQELKDRLVYPQLPSDLVGKRSALLIRHLDCGSCNGCELELQALSNRVYDSPQFGIEFRAYPSQANVLAMTGCHTRNLANAAQETLQAMPIPRVMTIGDCAKDGGIFRDSYALTPPSAELQQAIVDTNMHVPGCPPPPGDILRSLLQLAQQLAQE